jgi:hypothetical protein
MADCIICAHCIDGVERISALTVCAHSEPICSVCFLRIRSLQRKFHCPTCKRELENIICSSEPGRQYNDFTIWGENVGEDYIYEQRSQMFFPKEYYREKVESLWQLKCRVCFQTRRDFKGLRGHLSADHNLQLCMLCIEHKQVFPAEQKVYTKSDYDRHVRSGDQDGSIGHPNCEFCRTRFYDSTALFIHLNKEHENCFLCDQQGIKFKFFHTYQHLESHFRNEHYLCEEKSCLERRFVAFSNEIDLRSHLLSFHPQLSVNRTIPLQFKVRRSDSSELNITKPDGNHVEASAGEGASSTRNSRYRYEGGLGGHATQGIWQVELMPSSVDPRDPNRNFTDESGMIAAASREPVEDFPALAGIVGSGTLISNRWISTSSIPSTSAKAAKKQQLDRRAVMAGERKSAKNDFPALPSSKADSNRTTSKVSSTEGKKYAQVAEIEREYAHLGASGVAPSAVPSVSDFGDWMTNMRMGDKRLAKAASVDASDKGGWNSSGFVPMDYEAELSYALQESLALFNSAPVVVNPVKPSQLSDTTAYPSLQSTTTSSASSSTSVRASANTSGKLASSSKVASTGSYESAGSRVKVKKASISNDWSNALKAVGMELPGKKKKKSCSGLTVISAKNNTADKKLAASLGSAKK